MLSVSNQVVCDGYSTNVGYYYRINFPLDLDGVSFTFRTPTDFGMGGAIYLDGKQVVEHTKQEWIGGGADQTGFDFTATLDSGNHVIEYLGS